MSCPALSSTRESMYQMWLERSVMFPSLHAVIRAVLASDPADIVQFVLELLALPSVLKDVMLHGDHFLNHISYMTRTFAFYMHRHYKQLQVQQCHDTPPNKHVIKYSVTGPDASGSDHHEARGSQYGLGDLPSSDDRSTPHHRSGSTLWASNLKQGRPETGSGFSLESNKCSRLASRPTSSTGR